MDGGMIEINKIYCEDCLETMARMQDNFIDIVVTSPPYNFGNGRKNGDRRKNNIKRYNEYKDNLSKEEYFDISSNWINEMLRVTKYHIFYNIQEHRRNMGIIDFLRNQFKAYLKETFIWAKTNPPCSIEPTVCGRGFEYIFCFSKDAPESFKFNYCNFSSRDGDYVNTSIIKAVNNNKESGKHSFAFPEFIPEYFIKYFSKKNALIYDPFLGSGTTVKMAVKLNRNWIASEISAEYVYEIAEKRISYEKSKLKLAL